MNLSIIGTGYVGLVSGTCFAEMGNNVICVDNNPQKLEKLRAGEVTIYEPGLELIFERNIEKKRLSFTDDLKYALQETSLIFFCLPTPMGEDGSADLQYVLQAARDTGRYLKELGDKEFKVIVNKSTVPVGTAQLVTAAIKEAGVSNFEVVSNPEFLREGYAVEDFMKPDRIVIGSSNPKAFAVMRDLYEPFVRQGNPIMEMDTASSEVTKYAANSYLAMRITYMNEIANFCEKVGANVDNVRKGIGADNRIGKRFLFPGIGYGGSCFPKDVSALIKTADENGIALNILKTVEEVNENQKLVLPQKVYKHFNNDVKGKKFAVWGLSFKPNTDDMRQAPSIPIIKQLLQWGADIYAYDPAAMEQARYFFGDSIVYTDTEYAALDNADALLILTEWNEFRNPDYTRLESGLKSKIIFDGRNVFEPQKMKDLGFTYYSIGRQKVG